MPGHANFAGALTSGGAMTAGGVFTAEDDAVFEADARVEGFLGVGAPQTYTIASGVITVTNSNVRVDTEGAAASDDLTEILGGSTGDIVILGSVNSSRDVTVVHDTLKIRLDGGANFTMGNNAARLMLQRNSTGVWCEIGRGAN